jgi:hypothetical protein
MGLESMVEVTYIAAQQMTAIGSQSRGERVASLSGKRSASLAAIDFLTTGG